MLGVEPAVPVHFGVIESEPAVSFVDLDSHVWVACEELVAEGAVFVGFAHPVGLVDDGADGGVFVLEDGGDEMLVGEVVVAEVEVGCSRCRCSVSQSVQSGQSFAFFPGFYFISS